MVPSPFLQPPACRSGIGPALARVPGELPFGGDSIGVGFGIGIGIEGIEMSFGHERLDVYRAAVEYVSVREESAEHAAGGVDTDTDTDSDPEGRQAGGEMPNEALHRAGATEPIGKRARLVSAPAGERGRSAPAARPGGRSMRLACTFALLAALAGCGAAGEAEQGVRAPVASSAESAPSPAMDEPAAVVPAGDAGIARPPETAPTSDAEDMAPLEEDTPPPAVATEEPAPAPAPPAPAPAVQDLAPQEDQPPAPKETDGGTEPAAKPEGAAAEPGAAVADEAEARKLLEAAAKRQGGAELAEEGRLESFRVVFHKVAFEQQKTDAQGVKKYAMVETADDGVKLAWKAPDSLRSEMTLDGNTSVRAWYEPRRVGWIWDGQKTSPLLGEKYAADREQLERERRMIRALLDAAFLSKLLRDGSTWRVLSDDATFPGTVALRRTPPEGSETALALTLWIDPKSHEVRAARVPPREQGESIMTYALEYHDTMPEIAGSDLRFPFHITALEQRIEEQEPRKVMEAWARSVEFNNVEDSEFRAPR